jgi:competence protein ComGC
MLFLILMMVVLLAISIVLLVLTWDMATSREAERMRAGQEVRALQRQTIKAMFRAARPDNVIDVDPDEF